MNVNCVQRLMVSGGPESSMLESLADGFLKLPQLIWQGHTVVVQKNDDFHLVPEKHLRSCTECCCIQPLCNPSADITRQYGGSNEGGRHGRYVVHPFIWLLLYWQLLY